MKNICAEMFLNVLIIYLFFKIRTQCILLIVILFSEDNFYSASVSTNWIDFNILCTFYLRYFSFLSYILHKLISSTILVLRQFCRHGRLPQKGTRRLGASTTKSNHPTLPIATRLHGSFSCLYFQWYLRDYDAIHNV